VTQAPARVVAPAERRPEPPVEFADEFILPDPPAYSPKRRLSGYLAVAAASAAIALCASSWIRPDPYAELHERAHSLAASGRSADAVRSLRQAALLAPPEAASRLVREADVIEKK
jgi:hypothetical protein